LIGNRSIFGVRNAGPTVRSITLSTTEKTKRIARLKEEYDADEMLDLDDLLETVIGPPRPLVSGAEFQLLFRERIR
jgi:hypothetical protein